MSATTKHPIQTLKVIITNHAKDRLREMGLEFKKVYGMLRAGEVERVAKGDKNFQKYKKDRYGDIPGDTIYIRNGSVVFTCRQLDNKFKPGEQICLLVTATDQVQTYKGTIPVDHEW